MEQMTRREELLERYEDALFSLLMDEVAAQEGKRLAEENRRLRADPNAEVPEELDRRCLKLIKKTMGQQKRRAAGRAAYKAFSKVAVVAVACIMLFSVVYAAVPAVRVGTLNLLIEVSDVATKLKLVPAEKTPSAADTQDPNTGGITLLGYSFPAPPEGFVLDYEPTLISDTAALVWFIKSDREFFYYDVSFVSQNANTYVDTEDAKVTQIEIHGYDGLLIEKENPVGFEVHIIWGDTDRSAFCSICSTGLDVKTVLDLAKQVTYPGE